VANKLWFNLAIVGVIILDSVLVGIEVDRAQGTSFDSTLAYWLVDLVFAIVFFSEMMLRLNQSGWDYFRDPWNIFDYICVSVGTTALIQPLEGGSPNSAKDATNLRMVKTLKGMRVLRLLRIVRHIGGLKVFEGLWLIINSLLNGLRTLVWISLLMVITIYVLSVMLAASVGTSDELYLAWPDAAKYVGSVQQSMLTILQVCTLDSWTEEIGRPILEGAPMGLLVLYIAMVVVTFGILNVILAVMIEHIRDTMERNKRRTEAKLKATQQEIMQSMLDDFRLCRLNEEGALSYSEFVKLTKTPTFAYKLRLCGIHHLEAHELFKLMDFDGNGAVTPDEFLAAMHKIKGDASGQDLVHVLCFAEKQSQRAREYVQIVRKLSDRADELQRRLNAMGTGLTRNLVERHDSMRRNEARLDSAAVRMKTLEKMDQHQSTYFPQATSSDDDCTVRPRPPPPPPIPRVLSSASLGNGSSVSSLDADDA